MLNAHQDTPSYVCPSNLFPFDDFLRSKGLTRTTGYRYRRDELIKTANISCTPTCKKLLAQVVLQQRASLKLDKVELRPTRR